MWQFLLLAAALLGARQLSAVKLKALKGRVQRLEDELEQAVVERKAERAGRIRAQKDLREKLADGGGHMPKGAYPFCPIGILRSCFSTRSGTPRQPLLVPSSRALLELSPGGVPAAALEGLDGYSHCWLLFVFHANTDLARLWDDPPFRKISAKVRVPRMEGEKLGVLATRSPHRPNPIGLSVAKIEWIKGRTIMLSGADVVNGTPVLDIKPYLPYCDDVKGASAPAWVMGEKQDDPLMLGPVRFAGAAEEELECCWRIMARRSLYASQEEVRALICETLSRDIRSSFQRKNPRASVPLFQSPGATSASATSASATSASATSASATSASATSASAISANLNASGDSPSKGTAAATNLGRLMAIETTAPTAVMSAGTPVATATRGGATEITAANGGGATETTAPTAAMRAGTPEATTPGGGATEITAATVAMPAGTPVATATRGDATETTAATAAMPMGTPVQSTTSPAPATPITRAAPVIAAADRLEMGGTSDVESSSFASALENGTTDPQASSVSLLGRDGGEPNDFAGREGNAVEPRESGSRLAGELPPEVSHQQRSSEGASEGASRGMSQVASMLEPLPEPSDEQVASVPQPLSQISSSRGVLLPEELDDSGQIGSHVPYHLLVEGLDVRYFYEKETVVVVGVCIADSST